MWFVKILQMITLLQGSQTRFKNKNNNSDT